jgi:hypothetical protein
MVPLAVRTESFLGIDFAVILSTLKVIGGNAQSEITVQ